MQRLQSGPPAGVAAKVAIEVHQLSDEGMSKPVSWLKEVKITKLILQTSALRYHHRTSRLRRR